MKRSLLLIVGLMVSACGGVALDTNSTGSGTSTAGSGGGTSVGVGGGTSCVPTPEVCDGKDNDCNGEIDDLLDLSPQLLMQAEHQVYRSSMAVNTQGVIAIVWPKVIDPSVDQKMAAAFQTFDSLTLQPLGSEKKLGSVIPTATIDDVNIIPAPEIGSDGTSFGGWFADYVEQDSAQPPNSPAYIYLVHISADNVPVFGPHLLPAGLRARLAYREEDASSQNLAAVWLDWGEGILGTIGDGENIQSWASPVTSLTPQQGVGNYPMILWDKVGKTFQVFSEVSSNMGSLGLFRTPFLGTSNPYSLVGEVGSPTEAVLLPQGGALLTTAHRIPNPATFQGEGMVVELDQAWNLLNAVPFTEGEDLWVDDASIASNGESDTGYGIAWIESLPDPSKEYSIKFRTLHDHAFGKVQKIWTIPFLANFEVKVTWTKLGWLLIWESYPEVLVARVCAGM